METEDDFLEGGDSVQMLSHPLILQDTFSFGGFADGVGWNYSSGLRGHATPLKVNQMNKTSKRRTVHSSDSQTAMLCVWHYIMHFTGFFSL